LTFDGVRLEKAKEWHMAEISGVVFVPPGEKLSEASLQLGVMISTKHLSGSRFSDWAMEKYHQARTIQRWYEETTADEACKIGLDTPRVGLDGSREQASRGVYLALHVCRTGDGASVCVEADEKLDAESATSCMVTRQDSCWREVCAQKWPSRRASLEAVAKSVLKIH
jgi:hypothetical protein